MSAGQAWAVLFVAGLLEIVWALGLKASEGFTRWVPSVVVVVAAAASFWLLALAMRVLPAGTAYAVWTGIGAAGTAVLGMVLFGESAAALRLACIGLIVAGVLGLKFASG
ncbi:quaternary ammonium compound efflux SMR transporter SugE [Quisquiliibacterium transsilvanicum]|jgi:quaternary ammonium compound-resistance protein SugE|uniref:Guanidinium exporter n=1 Tax=Quisquiliibacterium transsilvanicum TaxID=1549638 RepID=A0A7W8HIF8_9BURK|nr:quaternary ammonium compound efflux SMR transporter SugE [Quisquiliibacterium transsilvanicum]MBB5272657.1 quaternary ammonium compound-resistance protein SugE [Quisquiliibacterium transsilvanicum]